MVQIYGHFTKDNQDYDYRVALNINDFDEICEPNMSIKESDELISDAIYEKYGVIPDRIQVTDEV
jgi:hypothetical protein